MYYTEYLRIFRKLRILAILLAIGLALQFIGVLTHHGSTTIEPYDVSSSAVRVKTVQADGTIRTTITDSSHHKHIVDDLHPNGRRDITISGPGQGRHRVTGGALGVATVHFNVDSNGIEHTRISYSQTKIPIEILLAIASAIAAFFATGVAGNISRENDGHLEMLWTKPSSRERSLLTMAGIDALGILCAFAMTMLACGIFLLLFLPSVPGYTSPHLAFYFNPSAVIPALLLFPFAWYAMLLGASASLRHSGWVVGFSWPLAITLILLSNIQSQSGLGYSIAKTAQYVNYLNPLAHILGALPHDNGLAGVSIDAMIQAAGWLAALAALGIALSLVQWRRLEA